LFALDVQAGGEGVLTAAKYFAFRFTRALQIS